MNLPRLILFLVVASCAAAPLQSTELDSRFPDRIRRNDGTVLECRVLFEGSTTVQYQTNRKTQEIPIGEIKEIESIERSLRAFYKKLDELEHDDIDGLLALATAADDARLSAEARHTRWRVLTLDPLNEKAWEGLGGKKRSGKWSLKRNGKTMTFEQVRAAEGNWKQSFDCPTAHFMLRSDVRLEDTLDLAQDVERAYLAYYGFMTRILPLFPVEERPEVQVFSQQADYPNPPVPGQTVWYARRANQIYVDASEGIDRQRFQRHLAYCLMNSSFRRSLDVRNGSLPPWVREGLATMMVLSVRGEPGRLTFAPGTAHFPTFVRHANDDEPLALGRLMGAGYASFEGGTELNRHRIQAYTLTFFLMNGDERSHRTGFGEYLRSAFKGQGGLTHMKMQLGLEVDEIETQWARFVDETSER